MTPVPGRNSADSVRRLLTRAMVPAADLEGARYQAIHLQIWTVAALGCFAGFLVDLVDRGSVAVVWIPSILGMLTMAVVVLRFPRWRAGLSMLVYAVLLTSSGVSMLREPDLTGSVLPALWAVLAMASIAEPPSRSWVVFVAALAVLTYLPLRADIYTAYAADGATVLGRWSMPVVAAILVSAVLALLFLASANSFLWRRSLAELSAQVEESDRLNAEMASARRELQSRIAERSDELRARSRQLQERTERLHSSLEHRTRLAAELRELSERDDLTGLHNRRAFVSVLRDGGTRTGPVALLVLDVDHFKRINDRHGHPVGDQVLIRIAATLAESAGPADGLARLGGEEFALLLPGTGLERALAVAERCRLRVAQLEWPPAMGETSVTISVGVVALAPGEQAPWDELMRAADQAMYEAKATGRNRVARHAVARRS